MEYIYINGEFLPKDEAKISVYDHGLLYGDGIFEGIRLYEGNIFRMKEHNERLFAAAKAIGLTIPHTPDEITEIVAESCRRNNLTNGYIRLVITRGVGDLGLSPLKCSKPSVICIAASIQLYPEELYEKGLSLMTAAQRRNKATILDPQIKSLNYLNNILARMEGDNRGFPEVLMLTHDGIVAECSADNVFIVRKGEIWTAPLHVGILDGITRGTVIDIAAKEGTPLYEKEFTLFNVYGADEMFITGSGAEIVPVISLDDRTIGDGTPGPITKNILKKFRELRTQEGVTI